ncbi:MAG: hypothetical protein NTX56_04395 [Proteobacteria bacterium]|nr:hypothetical protein [Pseudomonadota bacterium]
MPCPSCEDTRVVAVRCADVTVLEPCPECGPDIEEGPHGFVGTISIEVQNNA